MLFGEKLKKLRTEANMSQEELASKLGITRRSIVYYETKSRYPKKREVITGLAKVFNVPVDFLINDSDDFIARAAARFGATGAAEAMQLVEEIGGLFAGGSLNQEDKDKIFRSISDLYWESKEINKEMSDK